MSSYLVCPISLAVYVCTLHRRFARGQKHDVQFTFTGFLIVDGNTFPFPAQLIQY